MHATDCRGTGYTCRNGGCQISNTYPSLPPGTNNGQACVLPVVNPPGTGSLFATDRQISSNTLSAETELAVDPATHHVVVTWIDIAGNRSRTGIASSLDDGATFGAPMYLPSDATLNMNQFQSDPVVAVDPAGNFFVIWEGFDPSPAGSVTLTNARMWVARSMDSGATWQLAAVTLPSEQLTGGDIDKPWIAASPTDGTLTATWGRFNPANTEIRATRSTDHGVTWSTPITISETSARPTVTRNFAECTYGADGKVYVAWIELAGGVFGAMSNQMYFQRLAADGTLDGANVLASGGTDSPGFDEPSIAVAGSNVYVGFASGPPTGAWDIRVSASIDGGATFEPSVKVNDDATCATHFHHQLAVDGSGRLHAIWYDNRYLFGSVMHAQSPAATSTTPLAFGVNTYVNSAPFTFTTRRDQTNWLGDYLGFAIVGNSLYASWTDNRMLNLSRIQFAKGTAP
jgi:hypothetical protein